MTDQEIIIEVAKLDGWKENYCRGYGHIPLNLHPTTNVYQDFKYLPYLTSRDAIVPVIERHQKMDNFEQVMKQLNYEVLGFHGGQQTITLNYWALQRLVCANPRQLCIALLKATGKWKE